MPKRFPIYNKLLWLYPKPYRDKYASQMTQTLADMLDDQPGAVARLSVWIRVIFDLPVSILRQNVIYAGNVLSNGTPHYVKRNALISTALILPFFLAVFLKSLQNAVTAHPKVGLGVVDGILFILPLLAFALSATTLIVWSRGDKASLWRSVITIRHSWLLTFVGILALGIPLMGEFHDSIQCITGNPAAALLHMHQTLACIAHQSFSGK